MGPFERSYRVTYKRAGRSLKAAPVVLAVVAALASIFSRPLASEAFAPQECVSVVATNLLTTTSSDSLKIAAFDSMIESDYNKMGGAGAINVVIPGLNLPVGASFSQAKERFRTYKAEHTYSLDVSHSAPLVSSTVDERSLDSYVACLRQQAKGPDLKASVVMGAHDGAGDYREVAIVLSFVPGGGAAGVLKTTVTLDISSGGSLSKKTVELVGLDQQTVVVKRDQNVNDAIVQVHDDTGGGSPVYIQWLVPKVVAPTPPQPVRLGSIGGDARLHPSGRSISITRIDATSCGANVNEYLFLRAFTDRPSTGLTLSPYGQAHQSDIAATFTTAEDRTLSSPIEVPANEVPGIWFNCGTATFYGFFK
jgi:hypothetical protein